jgi:uncharacterized protein (AIM24 family)
MPRTTSWRDGVVISNAVPLAWITSLPVPWSDEDGIKEENSSTRRKQKMESPAQTPTTPPPDGSAQTSLSAEAFLNANAAADTSGEKVAVESQRVLRLDVDGSVCIKPGAAIAYRGDIKFERLTTLTGKSLREMIGRDLEPLVRATGQGRLYCAYKGWHVKLVTLAGGALIVNGDFLLAFEESLTHEFLTAGKWAGLIAGGVFVVRLSGQGTLAIAVHGDPLTLSVSPDNPLSTDPKATVAWSDGLVPELKTDLEWRDLIHHGGEEEIQFHFTGEGRVAVEPSEEVPRYSVVRKLKSILHL